MTDTRISATATALREAMIEVLWELGMLRSPRVEEALRAVPRQVFAPDVPLEEIYGAQTAVVTRRDEAGVAADALNLETSTEHVARYRTLIHR